MILIKTISILSNALSVILRNSRKKDITTQPHSHKELPTKQQKAHILLIFCFLATKCL